MGVDLDNSAISLSRKNSVLNASGRTGDAYGFNAVVNEHEAVKILGDDSKEMKKYQSKLSDARSVLDGIYDAFDDMMSGKVKAMDVPEGVRSYDGKAAKNIID